MKEIIDEQMVMDEKEQLAITRIQKFSKIAKTMGLQVHLGFSGGKDSQVCYDLCKRAGIIDIIPALSPAAGLSNIKILSEPIIL